IRIVVRVQSIVIEEVERSLLSRESPFLKSVRRAHSFNSAFYQRERESKLGRGESWFWSRGVVPILRGRMPHLNRWLPAPLTALPIRQAALLAVACGVPAVRSGGRFHRGLQRSVERFRTRRLRLRCG